MIEISPTIGKLARAMHAVQAAVGVVPKDSVNPHFRNKYASLESVNDAIREHYLAAGLVVMQAPGPFADGVMSLSTMIVHAESGEFIRSTMQIPVGKVDPQGAGSALTYAERYSLMALFNLPPVDDDADAAAVKTVQQATKPAPSKPIEKAPPAPPPGIISNAAKSSETRQALMGVLSKAQTRPGLRSWADGEKIQAAIKSMTDKDQTYFSAEFQKKWAALPDSVAMAG